MFPSFGAWQSLTRHCPQRNLRFISTKQKTHRWTCFASARHLQRLKYWSSTPWHDAEHDCFKTAYRLPSEHFLFCFITRCHGSECKVLEPNVEWIKDSYSQTNKEKLAHSAALLHANPSPRAGTYTIIFPQVKLEILQHSPSSSSSQIAPSDFHLVHLLKDALYCRRLWTMVSQSKRCIAGFVNDQKKHVFRWHKESFVPLLQVNKQEISDVESWGILQQWWWA